MVRVAGALGVQLTDAEVEALLERLVGVRELPPFRREDYDVYCCAGRASERWARGAAERGADVIVGGQWDLGGTTPPSLPLRT